MGKSPAAKHIDVPTSSSSGEMDFLGAVSAITNGKRVTRLEWGDENAYGELRDGIMMIYRDYQWYRWIINEGDLLGKDWIILQP